MLHLLLPLAFSASLPPGYNPQVSLAPLVDTLLPAVVGIAVKGERQQMEYPFPLPFPIPDQPRQVEGMGSGILISPDGYVLTNNHVVADATELKVTLNDDRVFSARVVGSDDRTDIALVKVDAKEPLPFAVLGSSDQARVGDFVIAIGQPFGLSHTVTSGIISAKGRVIGAGPYDDFIQTDASINPGNSGGPLYDASGQVIGINTAIAASGQGIGFAVPIDMVKPMIEELRSKGKVARGWLGITLAPLDTDGARQLGADAGGVAVAQVQKGVPGAKAGIVAGDVITAVDGKPVDQPEEVIRAIGARRPGDKIRVSLIHDKKPKDVDVVLAERPAEKELLAQQQEQPPEIASPSGKLGVVFDGTTVKSVDEEGPAAGRLRAGDKVVQVGRARIKDAGDLQAALKDAAGFVALFVERGGDVVFVPLRVPE